MMGILNILTELVTIVGFPALIVSLYFASRLDKRISEQLSLNSEQLSQLLKIARSQNNISLNVMMFNDATNVGIMDVVEKGMPILKEHEGQFTTAQLDKYLGDFETVSMVYQEGLLTREQMDELFSEYIEQLGQSLEVKEYLERHPDYFGGLRSLLDLYSGGGRLGVA